MTQQPGQHPSPGEPTTSTIVEPISNLDLSLKTPFYWRWRRTGNEYAIASLASSQALLQRISVWSSHTGREGRLIMSFADDWRSPLCLVEKWYQTQLMCSQDRGSTTRFTAIQHRRTLDAPFFHEFLLIPLADGSYYRLERTGGGSNVEAITLSGCTACDLIEWFPGDGYEA